jgi:hypothetical protein
MINGTDWYMPQLPRKHGLNGKFQHAPPKHGLNLFQARSGNGPQPPPNAQLNGKHPTPNGANPQLNGNPNPPNAPKPVELAAMVDDAATVAPADPTTAADAGMLNTRSITTSIVSTANLFLLIQSPLLDMS